MLFMPTPDCLVPFFEKQCFINLMVFSLIFFFIGHSYINWITQPCFIPKTPSVVSGIVFLQIDDVIWMKDSSVVTDSLFDRIATIAVDLMLLLRVVL